MKMKVRKYLVKGLVFLVFGMASFFGYLMYDLNSKEYVLPRGNYSYLTEDIAVKLCGDVLINEFNFEPNQITPIPYQPNGQSLLAKNKYHENEGSLIWHVSAEGFNPALVWHLYTRISIRKNDILVIVGKSK